MSNIVDWSSIAAQSKSSKKNDDLVFLNSKNLPQTFLPSPQIVMYESVYDDTTKKNRPTQAGDDTDKVRTQYLFYALFFNTEEKDPIKKKSVKICCCGQSVAEKIASVQKTLANLGFTGFVKVTSSGTGLTTKYEVEGVKVGDKNIPMDIWKKLTDDVAKLPGLEEMRDRLLGVKAEAEAVPEGAVSEVNKNNDLFI